MSTNVSLSCETWQTNSKASHLDISLFNYFHPLSLKVSTEHQSAVIQTPVGRLGLSPFHLMCSVTEYVSRVCVHTRLTTDVVVSVHVIGIEGKLRAFAAGIQWMCWVIFFFCLAGQGDRERGWWKSSVRVCWCTSEVDLWSLGVSGIFWGHEEEGRRHMPVICHNAAKCVGHAKSTGMPLTQPEYASGLERSSLFQWQYFSIFFVCVFACMLACESQRRTLVTLLNCWKELLIWLILHHRHGQHIYTKNHNAGIIIVKMFVLLILVQQCIPRLQFTSHKYVCSSSRCIQGKVWPDLEQLAVGHQRYLDWWEVSQNKLGGFLLVLFDRS